MGQNCKFKMHIKGFKPAVLKETGRKGPTDIIRNTIIFEPLHYFATHSYCLSDVISREYDIDILEPRFDPPFPRR